MTLLREAGFVNPSMEPTRIDTRDNADALLQGTGLDLSLADQVKGKIIRGFVRATRPGAKSTRACGCDDGCCA